MNTGSPPALGLELLPDWAPSANTRLARFDAVVKVAAGSAIRAGAELKVRLIGAASSAQTLISRAEIGELVGPGWREVHGRLLEVDPAVTAAEGLLGDAVSAPVFRRHGDVPVTLAAFRDMIGLPGEPALWWRYRNTTGHSADVRRLRAATLLTVDDRSFRLSTDYNGPGQLPPGRSMSGIWSFNEADDVGGGTHEIRLTIGDHVSRSLTAIVV